MPMIVDPIDRIARIKNRDVLMVSFKSPDHKKERTDWHRYEPRLELIAWLENEGIAWRPCYEIWCDGLIMTPYTGDLYIDVPFDRANEQYLRLEQHLENPDGTPRMLDVGFFLVPLEVAMQNAHHDDAVYED